MLRDEMITSGQRLFRWRSYTPLLLVCVFVAAMAKFSYPLGSHVLGQIWDCVCLAVTLTGFVVRIMTVGFVPRETSGRNTKALQAAEVNRTGMYSLLRHPLYFGNYWMWMGVALFPREWWLPILASLFYVLIYERIISAEEDFLTNNFGDVYTDWAQVTPIIWPRLSRWCPPAHTFSWRAVLRRENSTFLAIAFAFFAMECGETYVVEGHFELDAPWVAFFVFAVLLYIVLKLMKKLKLLNEPGR